jgi:FdrA protein
VAQATGKPVVVDFLGYPPPGRRIGDVHFACTLAEAAELAVELLESGRASLEAGGWELEAGNSTPEQRPELPVANYQLPVAGHLRALFSGGTLAYEAVLGLQALLAPLYANVPITEAQRLPDPLHSQAHTVLDLGEDVFTVGRLHPMLDNDLRLRRLRQEAADPEVGLIWLDVVLGEGAHPDPAAELAPAIAEARQGRGQALDVLALVIGTDADPQGLEAQARRLGEAGAVVCRTTAEALDYISRRFVRRPAPPQPPVLLERLAPTPFAAINVGLESFYDSLVGQGATAVHVDWRPPAGGNERLMEILARMKK